MSTQRSTKNKKNPESDRSSDLLSSIKVGFNTVKDRLKKIATLIIEPILNLKKEAQKQWKFNTSVVEFDKSSVRTYRKPPAFSDESLECELIKNITEFKALMNNKKSLNISFYKKRTNDLMEEIVDLIKKADLSLYHKRAITKIIKKCNDPEAMLNAAEIFLLMLAVYNKEKVCYSLPAEKIGSKRALEIAQDNHNIQQAIDELYKKYLNDRVSDQPFHYDTILKENVDGYLAPINKSSVNESKEDESYDRLDHSRPSSPLLSENSPNYASLNQERHLTTKSSPACKNVSGYDSGYDSDNDKIPNDRLDDSRQSSPFLSKNQFGLFSSGSKSKVNDSEQTPSVSLSASCRV